MNFTGFPNQAHFARRSSGAPQDTSWLLSGPFWPVLKPIKSHWLNDRSAAPWSAKEPAR
jgi:hypothetical protein